MKNIKLLAIIAIVAVFGFCFTACGPEEEEGDPKTIIISGIPEKYIGNFGYIEVYGDTDGYSKPIQITNTGSLTMDLFVTDEKQFTGSGNFIANFYIYDDSPLNIVYSGQYLTLLITDEITNISLSYFTEVIEKSITVTDIPAKYVNDYGYIGISYSGTDTVEAVSLPKKIANTTLNMDLLVMDEIPFTGYGDFLVIFTIIASENILSDEKYSGYIESQIINETDKITSIAFNDFIVIDNNVPDTYIITGTAPNFTATKDGTPLATTGAIQNVINAIRADANGEDLTIQFGNGTDTLNVGTGLQNIEFKNEGVNIWGHITFTGKISGATAGGTGEPRYYYLLDILANVSVTSSADITNTTHTPIRKFNNGTLTITGGIITTPTGFIGILVNGTTSTTMVNIQGGTISGGTGASCSATMNISGGTITGTSECAVEVNNSPNRLNILGGTIKGTGTARGIYIWDGAVVLSGNSTITSVTTAVDRATIQLGEDATATNSNNPALTIGANVIITNTSATGNLVYNPNNWKIKDDRISPPGGNLSNLTD
jgi:hypothetical protein